MCLGVEDKVTLVQRMVVASKEEIQILGRLAEEERLHAVSQFVRMNIFHYGMPTSCAGHLLE